MAYNSVERLRARLKENRNGKSVGVYSVCSSHPAVIKASIEQAKVDQSILLIESTSNQVNQFGGYTGLKPHDFINLVKNEALKIGLPEENIVFGGDHLGPNTWQNLNVQEAMAHSEKLIQAYIGAGFKKIHLDTSMYCADDDGDRSKPLADHIVAERAARLCRVAEETYHELSDNSPQPLYIIGTEVPVPGGARKHEDIIHPTHPNDALNTIEITKKVFLENGLEEAWKRVIGVVVQPGVEFGDDTIFHYDRDLAADLSNTLSANVEEDLIFEAHSTDYQNENNLCAMVEDHFSILKVGPLLTFAYREAVFALEAIEKELYTDSRIELSNLQQTIEQAMLDNPKYWEGYYQGTKEEQKLKRKYSFSDRSRYYWTDLRIANSVQKLMENIDYNRLPLSLVSQFMPKQFEALQNGLIKLTAEELVVFNIREALRLYARACGYTGGY